MHHNSLERETPFSKLDCETGVIWGSVIVLEILNEVFGDVHQNIWNRRIDSVVCFAEIQMSLEDISDWEEVFYWDDDVYMVI